MSSAVQITQVHLPELRQQSPQLDNLDHRPTSDRPPTPALTEAAAALLPWQALQPSALATPISAHNQLRAS